MTAAELYASGMTAQEVADHLGISLGAAKWAIRQVMPFRDRHESRSLRIRRETGVSVEDMAAMYAEGLSLRQISERVGLSARTIGVHLRNAGIERRSRGEGVRLSKRTRPKQEKPSRPVSTPRPKFKGETVEPPPPKSSLELCVEHNLSATERMLVLKLVAELRDPSDEPRTRGSRGRPPLGAVEQSPCEAILAEEGITHPRRQYHLMTCAIAAAKEAGVTFMRARDAEPEGIRKGA